MNLIVTDKVKKLVEDKVIIIGNPCKNEICSYARKEYGIKTKVVIWQ